MARPIADNRVYFPVCLMICPARIEPTASPILFGKRWAPAVAEEELRTEVKYTGLSRCGF